MIRLINDLYNSSIRKGFVYLHVGCSIHISQVVELQTKKRCLNWAQYIERFRLTMHITKYEDYCKRPTNGLCLKTGSTMPNLPNEGRPPLSILHKHLLLQPPLIPLRPYRDFICSESSRRILPIQSKKNPVRLGKCAFFFVWSLRYKKKIGLISRPLCSSSRLIFTGGNTGKK